MNEYERKVLIVIEKFDKTLPKFPDGRIDYSSSNIAPVTTVFIKYEDSILLLKRSDKVSTYHGKWNSVSGYLDEMVPIRKKILEELREEVGIDEDEISSIRFGKDYKFTHNKKTWNVYPALAELKEKPEIKIDWEHTEYRWIKPEELKNFDTVPELDRGLKNVLA